MRVRFAMILGGMALVTVMILGYLAVRVFVSKETIELLDFFGLCFYGLASFVMTIAQIGFLRHLTLGAGRQLEELTYADELTGLGNRRSVAEFLSEELREAQLSRAPLSLLFIDLDRLKSINDQHGHQTGDLALRAVAHALRQSVRDVDFVGRLGGDEFVVVLPDTDSQCASVVAHRIASALDAISVKVKAQDGRDAAEISELTASIGISSYPINARTRESLVNDADRAMYAAKNSGRGNIVISIAKAAGPERKASVSQITTFATQLEDIVDRPRSARLAKEHAPEAGADG
jgi:diguanylate cyclase (GGDEF)-like protein